MKNIEYLSPSSITKFLRDLAGFYCYYLSPNKPDREPQTKPMSVGSSFDAYAKSFIHEKLFGKGVDPKYEFKALFEAQVEPHNRDWALVHGKVCFDHYTRSGALLDLMLQLHSAIGEPKFEIDVKGVIEGRKEGASKALGTVTFLGKPDVFFVNAAGAHVIIDWKVNGYCSMASPMKGYVGIRVGNQRFGSHKDCVPLNHHGITINAAQYLEDCNVEWARQLSIYAWLCGEQIGSDFITGIDQLVCKTDTDAMCNPFVTIRVAEHRTRVKAKFQWEVFMLATQIWELVHSEHIFRDVSLEESKLRCQHLDGMAAALRGDGSEDDQWFKDAARPRY